MCVTQFAAYFYPGSGGMRAFVCLPGPTGRLSQLTLFSVQWLFTKSHFEHRCQQSSLIPCLLIKSHVEISLLGGPLCCHCFSYPQCIFRSEVGGLLCITRRRHTFSPEVKKKTASFSPIFLKNVKFCAALVLESKCSLYKASVCVRPQPIYWRSNISG